MTGQSVSAMEGIWVDASSDLPSDLSDRNLAYMSARQRYLTGGPSDLADCQSIVIGAFTDEVAADPGLLSAFAARFADTADVSVLLWADDADPDQAADQLTAALEAAGAHAALDLDLVLADPSNEQVGASVDAVLSRRKPAGAFHSPAHFDETRLGEMADLIARRAAVIADHTAAG